MKDLNIPKSVKSVFARISARQFLVTAFLAFVLAYYIATGSQTTRSTNPASALVPDLLMAILGIIVLVCLAAGSVKVFRSRKM